MQGHRNSARRCFVRSLRATAILLATAFWTTAPHAPASAAPVGGTAQILLSKNPVDVPSLVPGGNATYNIRIANTGTLVASGARIVDAMAPGLDSMAWTCSGFDGATCANPAGSGAIDEALDGLVPNGSIEYEVLVTVAPTPPPFVTNVAIATLPAGAGCADNSTPPCRAQARMGTGARYAVSLDAASMVLVPGGPAQFLLTIVNNGGDGAGTTVRMPVPTGLTGNTWTCSAGGYGAVCPTAAGSGAIDLTVATMPAGGQLTFTIDATVTADAPPEIVGSAAVIPPYGGSCGPNATPPPCTATARRSTTSRIDINKTGELQPPTQTILYNLTLQNLGAAADGTLVVDAMPNGISAFTWTCTASDGTVCPAANGSGAINALIPTWPTGGFVSFSITAQIAAGAPSVIVNTASATPPAGGICGSAATPPPCVASISTSVLAGGLLIEKDVPMPVRRGGGPFQFAITVTNNTTVAADGSVLSDPLAPGIASIDAWTCISFDGAVCPASAGSGPLNEIIATWPPLGVLYYLLDVTLDALPPPIVTNTATVTPPAGSSIGCDAFDPVPPCVASVSVPSAPVFGVGKYADRDGIEPGSTIAYRLDIFNFGADATAVQISDPLPAGIAGMTWTCTGVGTECPNTSGSGSIEEFVPSLSGDSGLSYDVAATFDATLPASVTNTLTVTTSGPGGCLIGDTSTVTPAPCVAEAINSSVPLLELEKVADRPQLLRGGTANYTLFLRNYGGDAGGSVLSDPLPVGIERFDWTCAAYAGAVCPAFSGSGALNETITTFPANGSLVYSVDAVVALDAPASIANVASVVPPASGGCIAPDCSATVTLPVAEFPGANIEIRMTADVATAPPGSTVNYTIEVTNRGEAAAANLVIADPLPTGISAMTWTCEGIECPNASGSGTLSELLPSLAAYVEEFGTQRPGRVTYRVAATVSAGPPATINNVATLTPASGDTCFGAICTATSSLPTGVAGASVLALAQAASAASLIPGAAFTYTITLSNGGPADAGATSIIDAMPAGIVSFAWTCAGTAGAVCPAPSGLGALNETAAAIPAGGGLTYTISAVVGAAPPASIVNTVVVTPPASATCNPASCMSTLALPVVAAPQALLALAKGADRSGLEAGGSVQYTVSVTNIGSAASGPAQLVDPLPAGIADATWTCAATGGATCPAASGIGSINADFGLAPGAGLTWTLQATVAAGPPAIVTNVASLTPSPGVSCSPASCAAQVALPTTAAALPEVRVVKTASPAAGSQVSRDQPIEWTLSVGNDGAPTTASLTLTDRLPANVRNLVVSPGAGVGCDTLAPQPGSSLVCTLDAGFTGQRTVRISAVVTGADAQGVVRNVVEAAGIDNPTCTTCSVSNPVGLPFDLALRNARPFSAAGIQGVLVDVVNLSPTAANAVPVVLSPASARRLFAVSSGGCTAAGSGGNVVVTCPNPPNAQGISCSGSTCTVAQLVQNTATTLFVALNPGVGATLSVDMPGDGDASNNTLVLEATP